MVSQIRVCHHIFLHANQGLGKTIHICRLPFAFVNQDTPSQHAGSPGNGSGHAATLLHVSSGKVAHQRRRKPKPSESVEHVTVGRSDSRRTVSSSKKVKIVTIWAQ